MPELLETYKRAQAYKNAADWSPTADQLREITQMLTAQLGGGINAKAVEETIRGLGWVARMVVEHDLDFGELMLVSDAMVDGTWGSLKAARMELTVEQGVQAGIGAGLYTGLLMGLMIREGKPA